MKRNQNVQGIVSKKGNVKIGNVSLEDNKITSSSEAENTQGVVAEIDVEVLGDVSIQGNEIIIWKNYQKLESETEEQVSESLSDKEIVATPEEQKVINKTILFLGTKELFINYRQATINNLIECYNKLEKSTGKLNRFTTASSVMNITSRLANIIPDGGVAEVPIGLAGDAINLTGNIIKEKGLKKFAKQFQEILAKDKKNLSVFDGSYLSLVNIVWGDKGSEQSEVISTIIKTLNLVKTELSPFSNDYDAFNKSVSGIWQGRSSIELEEMKSSIEAVINNFDELKKRLQVEKEELSEQAWFIAVEEKTDLLKQQTQAQIEVEPK